MATESGQISSAAAIALATDPTSTPFDYIVIGSGAGGGPLAARLAINGKRVLVIEAGSDPGAADAAIREVYDVPAYNAAATEDPQTSWDFSVRHYENDDRQRADSKYTEAMDPSAGGGAGKGGIFYPRAAALGGCTSHHAMIMIRPNDSDWDDIARATGDDSWRSENMQGYFPKIEQCLYYAVYRGFLGGIFGGLLRLVQAAVTLVNPRLSLDPNGHGFNGWQPTSFIDPLVIAGIARGDRTFLGLIFDVIWSALGAGGEGSLFKRALAHLQVIQFLDPNVRSKDIDTRARLSLISIGTDGKARFGLREWLLKTEKRHPQHLVLLQGAHATRLVFARDDNDPTPRAIGVEVTHGEYLYKASKRHSQAQAGAVAQYFARAEVIVCGGSFNTPQLLMLSGIGDAGRLTALDIPGPRDKDGTAIAPVVDLPGVGRNLQDRYEVSVVCEMKREFSTLKGATYLPGDANDPIRAKWLADKTGLYGTNGGALAMMLSSSVNRKADPDIFVFGVPAAFRGYYWNWSRELLWRTKGVGQDQRNLWTWVILKAYTDNNHGTVTLRSGDPFDMPDINFHSFSEGPSGYGSDVDALCDAVQRVRDINAKIKGMAAEVQPGASRGHGPAIREWVQDEAWGHHACGTCRIGRDPWQADSTTLVDRGAVLDSQFRVHGVRNLRVVDASVFSRIPGYFIVTPVFMISEKEADVLLADRPAYPSRIEEREAAAIHHRRRQLAPAEATATAPPTSLPKDCIGLALSGGGVRSSTYCLGVIQALARTKILPRVDILSSASGGGYVGGFLGRLYTRLGPETADKPGRVSEILSDATSPEIWWLRRYADYLVGSGRTDVETDLAIIARNLVTVLFCVGALLLAGLSALRWIADGLYPRTAPVWTVAGIAVSPWWPVAAAILVLGVLPIAAGYWLTPNANSRSPYSRYGLAAWAVSLGCAIAATAINGLAGGALIAIGVLLLSWFWQEVVRWRAPRREGRFLTTLYRNRLSRALGTTLFMLLAAIVFIVVDSLARTGSSDPRVFATAGSALLASPLLMFFRSFAIGLIQRNATRTQAMGEGLTSGKIILAVIVFAVATALFFAIDVLAHSIFATNHPIAVWMTLAAAIFSLAIGRGINFINLSSLQQSLTQKLTRTFLGASNDARVHPAGTDKPVPIQVSEDADDVSLAGYHPEENGGPLHLINVCVNQTVDHISGRQLPQNKGLPMCLGPAGISIGAQYHAVWEPRRADLADNKAVVRAIPVAADPHQFHVLARSDRSTATVEQLSLGRWLAISAASVSTGAGRNSSLPLALLLGLLNIRLGYWWDSGIYPGQRPGRYPPGLWRRIKSLPSTIFAVQTMLLDEWRAYFQGPSAKRWYLSDGGHFDNTGLYELIRRRLPFIIAIDGSQDEHYEMGDLAILMRQVRLDFGAELDWLDPGPTIPGPPWKGFDAATLSALLPSWITALIRHPGAIGSLASIRQDGPACAALARIHYAGQHGEDSWLLLIKASLAPDIPVDVENYAVTHPSFPNQPTSNQFFADDQWESYRALGERAGLAIF